MADAYKLQYDGMTLTYPGWGGHISFEDTLQVYNLFLQQPSYGTIAADTTSGYAGDIVTLSNTPSADCTFGGYSITGAILTGDQFTFIDSDVSADGTFTRNIHNLTLQQQTGGTITANKTTGYSGDIVTLSNTPSAEYSAGSYSITGATLTGNQFAFGTDNVTAKCDFGRKVYTLTLQNDGHGTISANKKTGYKGDTVTLSNTHNTYYRFNNYTQTGGSLNGSTFTFGNANATAKANFKVNYFTATGGYEKGSNQTCSTGSTNSNTTLNISEKYAIHGGHTGDIPSSWYSTSNRWKPNNVSSYSITLHPVMKITVAYPNQGQYTGSAPYYTNLTGVSYNGSTAAQQQTASFNVRDHKNKTNTFNYNKTYTITTQNINYGLSGKILIHNWTGCKSTATYQSTGTTGTWSATGIAP